MKLVRTMRRSLRRAWMNYALRGVGANDNHSGLDVAYRIGDPWNMDSDLERFRFERTNAIIQSAFAGVQSVLEIGCGEGHQTQYLQRVCPKVYGVDVSATAIERARLRVPSAQFAAGDVFAQPWGRRSGQFDLVVACEVLYYIADVQRTIDEMSHLGKACLVTIFTPAVGRIGPALERIPNLRKDWFGRREAQWVVAWWSGSGR